MKNPCSEIELSAPMECTLTGDGYPVWLEDAVYRNEIDAWKANSRKGASMEECAQELVSNRNLLKGPEIWKELSSDLKKFFVFNPIAWVNFVSCDNQEEFLHDIRGKIVSEKFGF